MQTGKLSQKNKNKGRERRETRHRVLNGATRPSALAPFRIRVNSICPGCVYTSATEREWIRMGETKEKWSARQAPLHMLNRVGEAREVANAILFLASDEASFITAAELLVDGGYVAK